MYTPSPHHEHEERERVEGERRAREERRERVTPTSGTLGEVEMERSRRWIDMYYTIDPHHDHGHLTTLLGVHGHWHGPVADAAKAFLRQLLADVEERDREARAKLEAISQEKFG